MPKNTSSKKSVTPEQAKAAILRFYEALQLEWELELQNPTTDWPHLFTLHFTLADLERRAPWLRKEVA